MKYKTTKFFLIIFGYNQTRDVLHRYRFTSCQCRSVVTWSHPALATLETEHLTADI